MEEEPFGIDVSRYQGVINWAVVKAYQLRKVRFVGIRATISWGYVDPYFKSNWQQARGGLMRSAYHVVYPNESVQRQCDNFLTAVGADFGELPLTLDVELDHGAPPSKIQDTVWGCATYLQARAGRLPLLYSRKQWLDFYLIGSGATPDWLNKLWHWYALYLISGAEHPGPALAAKGVDNARVIIHQTTPSGVPIGVQSKELDYNRWQSTEQLFLELTTGILSDEQKLDILWREAAAHGWNMKL